MRNKLLYYIVAITLLFPSGALRSQTSNSLGTFTPYSMFGMGELARQGTPFNRAMGGIGVSLRDHRFINYLNPASICAHDTLAFMLDFGIESQNLYHTSNYTRSAYNAFNMNHVVLSFPLYRKSAAMIGFTPYSHVGYKFEEKERRQEIINEVGDVAYQHYGEGSMNQLFIGGAMSISKNFSIGVQGIYYFGAFFRNNNVLYGDEMYSSIVTTYNTVLKSFGGKMGLQYEGKIKERSVISAGATFLLPSSLKGDVTRLATASLGSASDTLYHSVESGAQIKMPTELSVGLSFNRKYFADANINRWMIGFDYSYQDWSRAGFGSTPGIDFMPTAKSAYKLGFELTPNLYDVRYAFKHWTYRGGFYYEQSYVKLNGQQVNAMGLTFGLSVPFSRVPNMLNFMVDLGQRGSLRNELIRERYVIFQLSVSLYDIWFRKIKYE